MFCPFCLAKVRFKRESICPNPDCRQRVPALYVEKYRRCPPVVANAIGFSGHGKTVYFAALFYALKKLRLSQHWQGFFTMAPNEDSLNLTLVNRM